MIADTTPDQILHLGDTFTATLTAQRPDGRTFLLSDYATHSALVQFFAPPKSPELRPADRTADREIPMQLATDGLSWVASIATAAWAVPAVSSTRWWARFVVSGLYARSLYLDFNILP